MSMKIIRGDIVSVRCGSCRGIVGKVLKVFRLRNRFLALVSGVNLRTKVTKSGTVSREYPIDISNLSLYDEKSKLCFKVGFKLSEGGKKVRFNKLSGDVINV